MCKISTSKEAFQLKANCPLANRCMGYICVEGGAPQVNNFEQVRVVDEGGGARRVRVVGVGRGPGGSCN